MHWTELIAMTVDSDRNANDHCTYTLLHPTVLKRFPPKGPSDHSTFLVFFSLCRNIILYTFSVIDSPSHSSIRLPPFTPNECLIMLVKLAHSTDNHPLIHFPFHWDPAIYSSLRLCLLQHNNTSMSSGWRLVLLVITGWKRRKTDRQWRASERGLSAFGAIARCLSWMHILPDSEC